ncbi:MAG: hypothetical protein K2V38_01320 [Gemmataceae bacterium]|nr:hypothetical protein [Gemmataceae bacterium]
MRITIAALFAAALVGCGQKHNDHATKGEKPHDGAGGHTHGGDEHAGHKAALAVLDLKTRDGLKAGVAAKLRFTVPDAGGKPVRAFAVAHDAKVHFILIRQGLDTFAHLHPDVDPATGVLSAEYTFPKGGVYHLFADYQEPGGMPTTATARVEVGGDAPPAAGLKADVPGLLAGEMVAAKVSVEGAKAGSEAKVRFEVLDGGKPVTDLEPYMGAMGHLVVVSADGKQYVHAHPDEKAAAKNVVTFGAAFPSPGFYKGWGQFKRGGQVRVVPFVVQVP